MAEDGVERDREYRVVSSLLLQDLALHLGWKLLEGRDMMLSPNLG